MAGINCDRLGQVSFIRRLHRMLELMGLKADSFCV